MSQFMKFHTIELGSGAPDSDSNLTTSKWPVHKYNLNTPQRVIVLTMRKAMRMCYWTIFIMCGTCQIPHQNVIYKFTHT